MVAVEVSRSVYWVGAVDWSVRDFHGYALKHGTTYNAYLVKAEKVALVDTVKMGFSEELLTNIRELIPPEKIDYVVVNHVEPDHSGSMPAVMKVAENAKVLASGPGVNGLLRHYHRKEWPISAVKTGDELSLGGKTLSFIEAPMLHWPDSMFTYVKEDGLLLPNDAFGQHLATSQRFDDEVGSLMEAAAEYYANILMPFGLQIVRMIEKLRGMGIPLNTIAPSHGLIWRKEPQKIVQAYLEWSRGQARNKAVVVFDSMWGSTEKMAYAIAEGIASRGVEVKLFHLRRDELSAIAAEILDAKAILVGASTLNNGPLPAVASFLAYLRGLRPKAKKSAVFGSYGWGGGGIKAAEAECKAIGLEPLGESLAVKYVPDEGELQTCVEYGRAIADKLKA
ncbi:MAG: FprA family A-type flavoprotein [Candidatus Bathyarchaeia archaeon]